jgi:DNA phosphorothioation-associated putative methyltransferase
MGDARTSTGAVGKVVGRATYIHRDAIRRLPQRLQDVVADAVAKAPGADWNVCKVAPGAASLLLYQEFDEAPFPALLRSWTVDLEAGSTRETDYRARGNPPILHRKELLLDLDDPRRPVFAALTRAAEAQGLFAEANKIGTREAWNMRLVAAGLELRGHSLVPKGVAVVDVARHKTALARRDLSQPVALMLRWGLIDPDETLFDYGCGQGDDVAILRSNGIEAFGWDPHHAPEGPRREADAVNLGFVLNVIEDHYERIETLRAAWSYARRALAVSVMLVGQGNVAGQRPYKDGFLSSRGTFQRYFAHDELRQLVEAATGESSVTLAPGIVAIFRDKGLEQEVAYRKRSRAALIADGFVVPPRPPRAPTIAPSVRERIEAELVDIWRVALDLGRAPEAGEIPESVRQHLASARVSTERAIVLACDGTFDPALLQEAAIARREDLMVHFALSLFPGATRYATLSRSVQRDVKTFFRSHAVAMDHARRLLFSVGDPQVLRLAAQQAEKAGLGGFRGSEAFRFTSTVLARLPAPLRVIVGCAEVLYDDLTSAHFLEVPLAGGRLMALYCDDPARHFPRVAKTVEVDLQGLRARRRKPKDQVLYLKGRYLPHDDPIREAQCAIDDELVARGLVTGVGEGPSWSELRAALTVP